MDRGKQQNGKNKSVHHFPTIRTPSWAMTMRVKNRIEVGLEPKEIKKLLAIT